MKFCIITTIALLVSISEMTFNAIYSIMKYTKISTPGHFEDIRALMIPLQAIMVIRAWRISLAAFSFM